MNLGRDVFGNRPKFGVLIDPDFERDPRFDQLLDYLDQSSVDIILVGGSTSLDDNIDRVLSKIKNACSLSVLLFPGNALQLSPKADGLLLPSLISGRNSEYLIGKHVESALSIVQSGIPVFPMGYILVDGGKVSTTAYITQTLPIPAEHSELVVQTAVAGQLLGMKCIYLEAGSGARHPVSKELIKEVKKHIHIPLIIGGGIREKAEMLRIIDAGADMVIVGTAFEEQPEKIMEFSRAFHQKVQI